MKATLCLEAIGHSSFKQIRKFEIFTSKIGFGYEDRIPQPCWVAELVRWYPVDEEYLKRFLDFKVDYSKSNSKGSRGVFYYYILESGRLYQIKKRTSWSKTRTFFAKVTNDGEIEEISEDEVQECLEEKILE